MLTLPPPIRSYFSANSDLDVEAMLAPFAADAVVKDERRTHQGTAAIRAWIKEASLGNQAIAVPLTIQSDEPLHHVTAQVSGSFPGSPVTLAFHFRLDGGRIAQLEIL